MYKVFNMGHRMELYVPEEIADDIIDISTAMQVPAQRIGYVQAHPPKQVSIHSPLGDFTYR